MCLRPALLPNGVTVGCRECWQCRQTRVDDWVGRNIAETETSTVSYAVTLTYGRSWDGVADHVQSVQLMYRDIQLMLKRMRKKGYLVRYMIAGEYGGALGRAHWHAIFHFYGDVLPEWDGTHLEWSQEQWDTVGGIHIPEWVHYAQGRDGERYEKPLGHVHIKKATYAHTAYALKYMMKDEGDAERHGMVHMSRKPPLGYAYFTRLAREHVEAGISPQDLLYRFPVRSRSGQESWRQFMLRGRMAEIYVETFIEGWRKQHGKDNWPESELISNYVEFGELGDENRLTEKRVAEMPGPDSIFGPGGELKRDAWKREARKTFHGWLRIKDEEFRLAKQKRLRERSERNGEARQKRERWQQARSDEAYRRAHRSSGISRADWDALSDAERKFATYYPEDWKSLRDYGAGRGAKRGTPGGKLGVVRGFRKGPKRHEGTDEAPDEGSE